MKKNKFFKYGFTMIEILIVITIIGILTVMALKNFTSSQQRARDAKRKNDLNQLGLALKMYYQDFQGFPGATGTDINISGGIGFGDDFTVNSITYMKALPDFEYYNNGSDEFLLKITLEYASDNSLQDSNDRCCSAGSHAGESCGTSVANLEYLQCED